MLGPQWAVLLQRWLAVNAKCQLPVTGIPPTHLSMTYMYSSFESTQTEGMLLKVAEAPGPSA
jgi:hypothetical protein